MIEITAAGRLAGWTHAHGDAMAQAFAALGERFAVNRIVLNGTAAELIAEGRGVMPKHGEKDFEFRCDRNSDPPDPETLAGMFFEAVDRDVAWLEAGNTL